MGGGSSKAKAKYVGDGVKLGALPPSSLPDFYSLPLNSVASLKDVLLKILSDTGEVERLYEFLRTEFSEEVLDFYHATVEYSQMCSKTEPDAAEIAEAATEINKTYVARGSEYDVNIPLKTKAAVAKAVKDKAFDSLLFEKCVSDVIDLLSMDKVKRFVEVRKVEDEWERQQAQAAAAEAKKKPKKPVAEKEKGGNQDEQEDADSDEDEIEQVCNPDYLMSPEFLHHDLDLKQADYSLRGDEDWTPLSRAICGAYAAHGLDHGKSKTNQDRGLVAYPFATKPNYALFVNADGHGPLGHLVADFVVKYFHDLLAKNPKLGKSEEETEAALFESVVETDIALLNCDDVDSSKSGCAFVCALIIETTLYHACTGDSRIIIGREPRETDEDGIDKEVEKAAKLGIPKAYAPRLVPEQLTIDQDTTVDEEVARIEACGGLVEPAPGYMQLRVWKDDKCRGPGLQMTRTLGDHDAVPLGVIADPVIGRRVLTDEDKFIILASDGVWEYVMNDMAVKWVDACFNKFKEDERVAEKAVIALMKFAMKFWRNEGNGYRDDIGCTVVSLPCFGMKKRLSTFRKQRRNTQF